MNHPGGLFERASEDAATAALFSDPAWIRAFVRVEVALARAQAAAGLVPRTAAVALGERAESFAPDLARLDAAMVRDGFPILELVSQLRTHVGAANAPWVHWGATTQDILDTALVGQLDAALQRVSASLAEAIAALARLADAHRGTLMIGRTHLQPALPVTFGLLAASWLAPLVRHRRRLDQLRPRLRVIQCGGAAGSLASLGPAGPAVARAWAAELGLGVPSMPWHAQRDTVIEAAQWLGLVSASLAKFGHDVLLLVQDGIAEVSESADPERGGSSAMPQKRNAAASEIILVATRAAAAHLGALQAIPPPALQRGVVNAQLEFIHLPRLCALTGGAVRAGVQLARELVVDAARMSANLAATHGTLLAEAVSLALSVHLPPTRSRQLVRDACATALSRRRHLLEVIRELPEAAPALAALPGSEAAYLGSTDAFISAALAEATRLSPP